MKKELLLYTSMYALLLFSPTFAEQPTTDAPKPSFWDTPLTHIPTDIAMLCAIPISLVLGVASTSVADIVVYHKWNITTLVTGLEHGWQMVPAFVVGTFIITRQCNKIIAHKNSCSHCTSKAQKVGHS